MEVEYFLGDIVEGFSVKINLGFDVNQGDWNIFELIIYINIQVVNFNGLVKIENYMWINYLFDVYFNYDKLFNDCNNLKLILGYFYQDFYEQYLLFEG